MAITNAGKQVVLNAIDAEVNYFALRNSVGEFYRKPTSESFIDGDTLVIDTFLDTGDGNDPAITRVDIVMNGTGVSESGDNFAQEATSFEKDSAETMTISAEIQVVEV